MKWRKLTGLSAAATGAGFALSFAASIRQGDFAPSAGMLSGIAIGSLFVLSVSPTLLSIGRLRGRNWARLALIGILGFWGVAMLAFMAANVLFTAAPSMDKTFVVGIGLACVSITSTFAVALCQPEVVADFANRPVARNNARSGRQPTEEE